MAEARGSRVKRLVGSRALALQKIARAAMELVVFWPGAKPLRVCVLRARWCFGVGLTLEAGTRPGGRGTFLLRGKKVPKEARPTACDPFASLRGNLCRGADGVGRRNSLRAL